MSAGFLNPPYHPPKARQMFVSCLPPHALAPRHPRFLLPTTSFYLFLLGKLADFFPLNAVAAHASGSSSSSGQHELGGRLVGGERPPAGMVVLGGGGAVRRRRAWRWAMRAVASAVLWTAVVQLASIAGLFRPRVLADCAGGVAAAGLAALAGEDSVAARLSLPVLVLKSECFYSILSSPSSAAI
jgi:hypothetical protein